MSMREPTPAFLAALRRGDSSLTETKRLAREFPWLLAAALDEMGNTWVELSLTGGHLKVR
jgi:hypothetical protein